MKFIIILSTLLAMVYAKTFRMMIHSSGTRRARLAGHLYENNLAKQSLSSDQVPNKQQLQPFRDYYDDFYLGDVTIGTPGQNVSLLLDTGSANLWVFDTSCRSFTCRSLPDSGYTRRMFNTRKSSTFRRERRSTDLRYGAGWCSGPIGKDIVSFSGVEINQQEFVLANEVSNSFGYMAMDGILGLGLQAASVGGVTSPIQNILTSLDAPLFTIWMDKKNTEATSTGFVTFGAIDTTNCQAEISYVPLSSEKHWQFPIEGFSIGNFSSSRSEQVIAATGTSWIGAPTYALNALIIQTGARFDSLNKFYTVDCSTKSTLPDLVFTINGVKHNVPSDKYVLDIGLGEGQCALTFFELFSEGTVGDWILGDAWFRTYCNIFDIGNKRIGFSKAIHSVSK